MSARAVPNFSVADLVEPAVATFPSSAAGFERLGLPQRKEINLHEKLRPKMVRFSELGLHGAKITVATFQAAHFQWS